MKKKAFILCMALVWAATLMAQNIAVVYGNDTDLYSTLKDAIEGATDGSVIYLPGGRFSIGDSVKITKNLTIIGIGHYLNNNEGNEDGYTRIEGNLWFNENSSGSAVMACYITGNVNIGEGDAIVNDFVIRYCNLNSVQVKNSACSGTTVNQNYVRESSHFCQSNSKVSNNVTGPIIDINGGLIKNNIINGYHGEGSAYTTIYARSIRANNSNIINNIILPNYGNAYNFKYSKIEGSDNAIDHNMSQTDVGESPINIGEVGWDVVFVNYNDGAISPLSNFHFKETYIEYENQVGIYAGLNFNDKQLAPVPYIVDKQVASETDASGKLNIKIRVKASE